jgi:Cd2+/Zn2+-exporting ATPase
MAFLTAASPCALAIGTPTAILCGIAQAARMGVLIKGGAHLETLGKVRAIAFDKTGTLTSGKPSVDRVVTHDSLSVAEALRLAAAVDQHTSHPFAASIVKAAQESSSALNNGHLPDAIEVVQIPGEGATGQVNGNRIAVGKSTLAGSIDSWPAPLRDSHDSMQREGLATATVVRDGSPVAVIGLLDKPRDHAAETVKRLHQIGVTELSMLTGDHAAVAQNIAQRLGIDRVHADLLPQQKLEIIDELMKRHEHVAMIGDGVNDAPALAKASLGIAMGAAAGHGAADVAIETADVVLMGQDLSRLADGIELARKSRRIIAQNLTIALGVIGIVAPLAALGFAGLGWAVTLHEGSTVVVVLNSLRLLKRQ